MSRTGASLIRYFLPLFVFTCLLLCGCGGMNNNPSNPSTPNNPQTTQVRVVDANGMMPSVNVVIGSTTVLNNVTFLTKTNFVSVPAGMQQLTLNGWLDPPNVSAPENFASGANMTLFFEGCGIFGESSFELLTDDLTPPAAGNFKLRIVDAAINGGGIFTFCPQGSLPAARR
ncbi:MAG TPA: DUF4397 domain-containing protein [Candidatus Angelobacter sp.]|nr:DUF4397 domain-containing protein [Candidatus Angelobacter sp.]